KLEKKATSELAAFVVKAMTKYKGQLGHDDFKHEAKKITKVLMEKERKSSSFDPAKLIDLGQHKKAKIKQFVIDYMSKLVSRRSNVGSPVTDTSVVRTPPAPSDRYTSTA
ncbi:histone methyltransferase set2, partial [Coemansia sp. RSA 2531]